jgi:aryl-alcohol dehydrogenase-like predicted oxidoreductase
MGVPEFYGSTDEAESLATIERALELGIGFVRYSPLGRGVLTGKITKLEDHRALF